MSKKILWCSDAWQLPTGYSQVSRNVISNLYKAGFDTTYLSFQNVGFPSNLMISERMIAAYNIIFPIHPNESYGNQGSVEFWNNDLKPEITAFLADSFMIKWMADNVEIDGKQAKRRARLGGKTLFYFPLDSQDCYDGVEQVMNVMDIRVAMSKWSQEKLKKGTGIDSHYIPHGVDNHIYRPYPEEIRDQLRKQNNWEGKFVVGSVGRNQSRKNIPNLMKAFQIFADGKDDAILFLHCDPKDPNGTDLIDLSKRLGIENQTVFGMKRFSLGVTETRMNMVYNTMDVHCLSTTGEGFGLPIVESMSAGVPNICTDYTTARELIEGHGELVDLAKGSPYIVGQLNTNRAMVDYEDMAKKIEKLYNNESLRKKYSKLGRKHVIENYSWDRVLRMWINLIERGEATDV